MKEESLLFQSSDGCWKVHVGTFVNAGMAERYKDEALLKGKEIEVIERRVSPETTWYRVMAQKFSTKEEGIKTIQGLSKKGLLPALKKK
jgi:cell division protein FtsN